MSYALLCLSRSYYRQGEEALFKKEELKWEAVCWWEPTIPVWKVASRKGKAQVAQGGFDTNLILAMVFLWQSCFIELADFSPFFFIYPLNHMQEL